MDEVMSTILAPSPDQFRAQSDAMQLKKAMAGLGSDKTAILSIVGARTSAQLREIKEAYETMYKKSLASELKSELSFFTPHFSQTIQALLQPSHLREVNSLREALTGVPDTKAVIQIVCSKGPREVEELKQDYFEAFGSKLSKDVKDITRDELQQLLMKLLKEMRAEDTGHVSLELVESDVGELYRAGAGRIGTHELIFAKIFALRSFEHLRAVFTRYADKHMKGMEEVIKSELSFGAQEAYLTIIRFATDPYKYYAKLLNQALTGFATDDKVLIRMIVSRAEVDMLLIKDTFRELYGKSLESMINGSVTGDYKSLLLLLIGSPTN